MANIQGITVCEKEKKKKKAEAQPKQYSSTTHPILFLNC